MERYTGIIYVLILLTPAIIASVLAIKNRNLTTPGRVGHETLILALPGFIAAFAGVVFTVFTGWFSALLAATIAIVIVSIVKVYGLAKGKKYFKHAWMLTVCTSVWLVVLSIVTLPSLFSALFEAPEFLDIDFIISSILGLGYLVIALWNGLRIHKLNKLFLTTKDKHPSSSLSFD